jgi:hypothetical protein
MQIFQPPVNFCSDKNIQTIFGTKLEDFLNYRIDYNLISQTVEKVVKNSYLCNKLGKVIFFLTRCGIFNRDEVEIKNASTRFNLPLSNNKCTESLILLNKFDKNT